MVLFSARRMKEQRHCSSNRKSWRRVLYFGWHDGGCDGEGRWERPGNLHGTPMSCCQVIQNLLQSNDTVGGLRVKSSFMQLGGWERISVRLLEILNFRGLRFFDQWMLGFKWVCLGYFQLVPVTGVPGRCLSGEPIVVEFIQVAWGWEASNWILKVTAFAMEGGPHPNECTSFYNMGNSYVKQCRGLLLAALVGGGAHFCAGIGSYHDWQGVESVDRRTREFLSWLASKAVSHYIVW